MIKHFAVLASLAIGLASPSYAEDRVVKIGTEANYAPFEYKDANGALKGLEIELADTYCARSHLKCEWVNMDFDGLIPALNAHQIDAIIAQLGITDDRKKSVAFTLPVTRGDVRLVAPKGSTITEDPATFKGKTVAVQSGTIEETWANAHLKSVAGDVKVYQSQDQAFEDLKAGRVDVSIADSPVAYDWLQKDGKDGFDLAGKPLDDPAILGTGETAMAVRLDDKALLASLNTAITDVRKDGSFTKITAPYFPFSLAPKP